jgi:hypothetical protein
MSKILACFLSALFAMCLTPPICQGGPSGRMNAPALDHTLMGFKEQGAWYFLCTAPAYPVRIGPSYQTYGPPPPPCPAPPCAFPPPVTRMGK